MDWGGDSNGWRGLTNGVLSYACNTLSVPKGRHGRGWGGDMGGGGEETWEGMGRRHGRGWGGDMGGGGEETWEGVGRRHGRGWGGDMGGWGGDMGRNGEETWEGMGRRHGKGGEETREGVGKRYGWRWGGDMCGDGGRHGKGWGGDMGGDERGRREDIFMSFNNETVIPHRLCWPQYPGCPTEGAKPHRTALRTVGLGRSVHKITGQGAWQVTLYSEFVGRGICRSDGVLGVRNRAHPCPLECPMLRRGHTHY